MKCRWKELRATTLSLNNLSLIIDSVANLTAEARQRHFAQWPVLGQYVWPNPQPIPATYSEEIQTLKKWLASRLDWIDKNLPNTGTCADYPAGVKNSFIVTTLPNPYRNGDYILVQAKNNQVLLVKTMDASGKLVWYSPYKLLAGNNYFRVPVDNWANGIYFFEFKNEKGERATKKILNLF